MGNYGLHGVTFTLGFFFFLHGSGHDQTSLSIRLSGGRGEGERKA